MARTPNRELADLLAEARWGNDQLARAVNRIGRETGLELTYDHSAVSHWLKGVRPRAAVRPVIAEAFARRLARPVTSQQAGFGAAPAGRAEGGTQSAQSALADLSDLVRDDMDPSRRSMLAAGLYSAAMLVPGYTELAHRLDGARAEVRAGRTVRIGESEVETVRAMTERIAAILDELGGGHARPMSAAFLANTVMPWLSADGTPAVKKSMLAAASDLVYLTGWMAMYERAHGLGQQYFGEALNLAQDGQDHVTYCRTLRGMSLQAANLGYGPRALEYADAAAECAPAAGPRLTAFLRGQQAHGAALVHDQRLAFTRLNQTEAALAKADGRNDAVGGYDWAAYHFHVSSVLYALGDLPRSIQAMRQSNRVRPANERQGRLHANGVLASRQWELGHVEAAATTWHEFLNDYTTLSTARGDEHFDVLRRSVATQSGSRVVRRLGERVREVGRQKTATATV
ncbi:hypothetical protein C7C46_15875 [Streptomyces tateyamensis]|uniref:Transcriptional regulator n=1 Tax=Streptomyces tateyamensis TaxID=565073 RepID=A0A2V4NRD8_9ACTN|nr:hypothetical protein [Streptomyces tateyamensis]PYC78580.1 hypothetical protein C7C46_15875 [Streptomyces tateyamensis]